MNIRTRVFVEVVLSAILFVGFISTLIVPDWIEAVFGADPDGGNGEVEWGVVIGFGVLSLLFAGLARFEWFRWRRAIGSQAASRQT